MKLAYLLYGLIILAACSQVLVTNFEECLAAGNPAMESHPRQCIHDGENFVEVLDEPVLAGPEFTACDTPRPEACTREYNPVCAMKDNGLRCITSPCQSEDAVTESTSCTACSDQTISGHYPGPCEVHQFVVCADSVNPFDINAMAIDPGWICVDICPGNYDPYITQIGATFCINHYGENEIGEWEVCSASSTTCNCVKAYETTQNDQIGDAEFRCVPDNYAERLLFRGGQEHLDEDGQASVVIA